MKNLKNFKGAKTLGKMEQKQIKGGRLFLQCEIDIDCPAGWCCEAGRCIIPPSGLVCPV